MTYHAGQKGTQNIIWNLLFSAQMQPIYACCSCCPGCYFMPPTNPRLYSTDLVQLYPYLTITTFYKLWYFTIKSFILSLAALLVCIACFWAKQPYDTCILKLAGILNQTRHLQNQGISIYAIRVENTAHQNPNYLLTFSFIFCNIHISFYCVCECICSPSASLRWMTNRNILTIFNMEFFEKESLTPTTMPKYS
jgi:hypothetical protein